MAEDGSVDYANLIRAQTRQVDIDAFKERGMKKVNVINAKKINELISQAVTNIIGKMEDADIQTIKDDKAQIVMDSMSEFKRLFSEQKKEAEQQKKEAEQNTNLAGELVAIREQMAKSQSAGSAVSSTQMQNVSDEIAELKAFMVNQASKAQGGEMTRTAMMEQQQELLEDHCGRQHQEGAGRGRRQDDRPAGRARQEARRCHGRHDHEGAGRVERGPRQAL